MTPHRRRREFGDRAEAPIHASDTSSVSAPQRSEIDVEPILNALTQVYAGAALLGVLALLVHLTTSDVAGRWRALASAFTAVTMVTSGLALVAADPGALGLTQ